MTPDDLAARKTVLDIVEPILGHTPLDLNWLRDALGRLEGRNAFASVGGLAGLARYAHLDHARDLLRAHSPRPLVLAIDFALASPDRLAGSEHALTRLLEQQLMRDAGVVGLLEGARKAWAERTLELLGRGLPRADWSSPWNPKNQKEAPRALVVTVAPFDETVHAPSSSVPRTPDSERHEQEWLTAQFPNTFHLRWIHDEAALRIWNSLDPRRVMGRLGECAPRFGVAGLTTSLGAVRGGARSQRRGHPVPGQARRGMGFLEPVCQGPRVR